MTHHLGQQKLQTKRSLLWCIFSTTKKSWGDSTVWKGTHFSFFPRLGEAQILKMGHIEIESWFSTFNGAWKDTKPDLIVPFENHLGSPAPTQDASHYED